MIQNYLCSNPWFAMATDVKFNRNKLIILSSLGLAIFLFIVYQIRGTETVHISEILSASIVLAQRGGKRIVEIRKMDDSEIGRLSKGHTKEGKDEYVTLGDKESHDIIVSGLKGLWPNLPLQSEESDPATVEVDPLPTKLNVEIEEILSTSGRDMEIPIDDVTVWIDPLDATHEYTEGGEKPELLKFVTVMVCIAVKGKPVAAVIHQPYEQNLINKAAGVTKWAWVGRGISETLVADTVPPSNDPNKIRIISSRSHSGDVKEVANKAFSAKSVSVEHIVAAGSGYKVLQVVENHAELYLHTTAIKKWDICAGNAFMNAVGGKMTTRRGVEIDYSFSGSEVNSDGLVVALKNKFDDYIKKVRIN